jgi:hypothetical protein
VTLIGSRYYVKATLTDVDAPIVPTVASTAYAREEAKKDMDGSQITGAASSYARKYALNGLFCIDDTKDSDATNQGDKPAKPEPQKASPAKKAPTKPAELPKPPTAQQAAILKLADALRMDVQKDICLPLEKKRGVKVTWPLTAPIAEATIKNLEKKKAGLSKELDAKVVEAAKEVFRISPLPQP